MIVVFGVRGRDENIAVATLACRACGSVAAHRIVKHARKLSVFFIPVIPLGTRHHSDCSVCGAQFQIPDEQAARMAGQRSP